MKPDFPVALNNRAWAYRQQASTGQADVEKSLRSARPARTRSTPAPTSDRRWARRALCTTIRPCGNGGARMINHQRGLTERGSIPGRPTAHGARS
jgi:hypothetical protein